MSDENSSNVSEAAGRLSDAAVSETLSAFSHDRSFDSHPVTKDEISRLAATDTGLSFKDVVEETEFMIRSLSGDPAAPKPNITNALSREKAALENMTHGDDRVAVGKFIEGAQISWSAVELHGMGYDVVAANKIMAKRDLARAAAVSRHILEPETTQ